MIYCNFLFKLAVMDKFVIRHNSNLLKNENSSNVQSGSSSSSSTATIPTSSQSNAIAISSINTDETILAGGYDIGNYIDQIEEIDDFTKHAILENHWKPGINYIFFFSVHVKCKREEKRRPNFNHLSEYPWLIVSNVKKGLFFKYCVIFISNRLVGFNNTVHVKKLVKEPLTKFSKLSGKDGILESHARTDYYKLAFQKGKDFLNMYKNPSFDIINIMQNNRKQRILDNRERLVPIIKTIIFHSRQNFALRGHRDDGDLYKMNESDSLVANEGNFRALLRFRIESGDTILENHLKMSGKNATYISKTSANELIQCCGKEVLDIILKRVKLAKFYCVIFDKTTDVSHTSQLSLSIRYIHENIVREDFVGFLDLHKSNYSQSD